MITVAGRESVRFGDSQEGHGVLTAALTCLDSYPSSAGAGAALLMPTPSKRGCSLFVWFSMNEIMSLVWMEMNGNVFFHFLRISG